MWRAFDETGRLAYPDFVETVVRIVPMYWVRVLGGSLFVRGCGARVREPAHDLAQPARERYDEPSLRGAAARAPTSSCVAAPGDSAPLDDGGQRRTAFATSREASLAPLLGAHARCASRIWVALAVAVASLLEILPTFLIRSNVPSIASVHPYTPLELVGP